MRVAIVALVVSLAVHVIAQSPPPYPPSPPPYPPSPPPSPPPPYPPTAKNLWTLEAGVDRRAKLETQLSTSGLFSEVGEKYCNEKIAVIKPGLLSDQHGFLRASNAQFLSDMKATGAVTKSSAYNALTTTLLSGDAHALNVGAYSINLPSNPLIVYGLDDYDENWNASWIYDVYRMASSIIVLGRAYGKTDVTDSTAASAVQDFALTYFNALDSYRNTNDEDTFAWTNTSSSSLAGAGANNVVYALLNSGGWDKVAAYSYAANRIAQLTKQSAVNGTRKFNLKLDTTANFDDGQKAVNSSVYAAILAALPAYYNNLGSSSINGSASYFTVLDIVEKVGSGLGSYGNARYWILVEGLTNSTDDDRILEIKRQGSPSLFKFAGEIGKLTSYSTAALQGKRVSDGNKAFIYQADAHAGYISCLGDFFSVRERSPEKKSISEKVNTYTADQISILSKQLGRVLAGTHSRTDGVGSNTFETAAYNDIVYGGGISKFQYELSTFALAYADQIKTDFALVNTSYYANKTLWCASPHAPKAPKKITVTYSFAGDYAALAANPTKLEEFKGVVRDSVAKAAGIPSEFVTVVLTAGSVMATTTITYPGGFFTDSSGADAAAAAVQSSLSSSVSSTFSSSSLTTYGLSAPTVVSDTPSTPASSNVGVIVGAVVGGVVGLALIAGVAYYLISRKSQPAVHPKGVAIEASAA